MRNFIIIIFVILTPHLAFAEAPASKLFGAKAKPAMNLPAGSYGKYNRGCLAGAEMLPIDGDRWHAMRLSRNRNWGHPEAIDFIERLSTEAAAVGWPGLLVGDISQPRGGPMLSGHRSHQMGLDIDIWLRPAPDNKPSKADREKMSSHIVVRKDGMDVNNKWQPEHYGLLRAAASDQAVARIFVNAAIKHRLCTDAKTLGDDTDWLRKIRPWWKHNAHFHVRLSCPEDAEGCVNQDPPPPGDGCDKYGWWLSDIVLRPWLVKQDKKAKKKKKKKKKKQVVTLSLLPQECREVLHAN